MKDSDRLLLFLTVCLPVRMLIALSVLFIGYRDVEHEDSTLRVITAVLLGVVAAGLGSNVLRNAISPITHGNLGGPVWSRLRVLHTLLWATAAILLAAGIPAAGFVLVADMCIAAGAGWVHYS